MQKLSRRRRLCVSLDAERSRLSENSPCEAWDIRTIGGFGGYLGKLWRMALFGETPRNSTAFRRTRGGPGGGRGGVSGGGAAGGVASAASASGGGSGGGGGSASGGAGSGSGGG